MTPQTNAQFFNNMETIAAFAGLQPLETKECKTCDCADGHACIFCNMEIGETSCINRDGHCIDCWNDLQFALKN